MVETYSLKPLTDPLKLTFVAHNPPKQAPEHFNHIALPKDLQTAHPREAPNQAPRSPSVESVDKLNGLVHTPGDQKNALMVNSCQKYYTDNKDTHDNEQTVKDPNKDTTKKTGNKDPTKDTTKKTNNKDPTKDTTKKTGNKDPTKDTTKKTGNKDPTKDTTKKTGNKDPTKDTTKKTGNKDPTKVTTKKTGNKDPTKDTNKKTGNKDPTKDTTKKTGNKDPTKDTTKKTGNKDPTKVTTNKDPTKDTTKKTGNKDRATTKTGYRYSDIAIGPSLSAGSGLSSPGFITMNGYPYYRDYQSHIPSQYGTSKRATPIKQKRDKEATQYQPYKSIPFNKHAQSALERSRAALIQNVQYLQDLNASSSASQKQQPLKPQPGYLQPTSVSTIVAPNRQLEAKERKLLQVIDKSALEKARAAVLQNDFFKQQFPNLTFPTPPKNNQVPTPCLRDLTEAEEQPSQLQQEPYRHQPYIFRDLNAAEKQRVEHGTLPIQLPEKLTSEEFRDYIAIRAAANEFETPATQRLFGTDCMTEELPTMIPQQTSIKEFPIWKIVNSSLTYRNFIKTVPKEYLQKIYQENLRVKSLEPPKKSQKFSRKNRSRHVSNVKFCDSTYHLNHNNHLGVTSEDYGKKQMLLQELRYLIGVRETSNGPSIVTSPYSSSPHGFKSTLSPVTHTTHLPLQKVPHIA